MGCDHVGLTLTDCLGDHVGKIVTHILVGDQQGAEIDGLRRCGLSLEVDRHRVGDQASLGEFANGCRRQIHEGDLAGLIVIDFIDMDVTRNNTQVEKRLKDAMRNDRARIQIGRISPFGLLEMSRQRLRMSLIETSSEPCPFCGGTGIRRSTDSAAVTAIGTTFFDASRRGTSSNADSRQQLLISAPVT